MDAGVKQNFQKVLLLWSEVVPWQQTMKCFKIPKIDIVYI